MKIILLLLLSANLYGQGIRFSDDLESNKVVQLICSNKIDVFDSNCQFYSNQDFKKKYYRCDICVNDMWTRPVFIDNIYHPAFDGVLVCTYSNLMFDSSFVNESFIRFCIEDFDNIGNYINSDTFYIYRKLKYKKQNIPVYTINPAYKFLTTNNKSFWANEKVLINNKVFVNDSCIIKYRLKLNSDNTFTQSYNNEKYCYTKEMNHQLVIGVEGNVQDFNKYSHRVQMCKIEHPSGFWEVIKNEIVFYSNQHSEIYRCQLSKKSDNEVELKYNENYKVVMRKF
jgi:hypothetical protein